tara:strand:+ start:22533 stop:23459 length:927 start_codon:yes stop_codon:yes gene_type:complete
MIKLGSLFSGIGGFELGLERALPQCKTIWQVEQNQFCQSVLRKHWADAIIYDDIRTVGAHNLESVDVLCGGFPCQDISIAGKKRGINNGKKSSLYYEMFRVICEIRPRIIVLENVAAILRLGGHDVFRTLAEAGYDAEWCTIQTGKDFGLPHIRKRWFCVAYPHSKRRETGKNITRRFEIKGQRIWSEPTSSSIEICNTTHTHSKTASDATTSPCSMAQTQNTQQRCNVTDSNLRKTEHNRGRCNKTWRTIEPIICRGNDGFPNGLDKTTIREHNKRLKALGNAITPQASEWVGRQILQSGLLDDLIQ